jgi:hypothetical protein
MAEQYPNRSDLRNPASRQVRFTGQTYGEGAEQARSQQAVAPGSAPAQVQAQQMAAQQAPRPGAKPLLRPTERPDEPITAGANFGPGPNAMQAGIMPRIVPVDETMEQLKVLYQMFPNPDLADLISKFGNRGL